MKLEIYRKTPTQFRWRIRARNGKITEASSEAFTGYRSCARNLKLTVAPALYAAMPVSWRRNAKGVTVAVGKVEWL